MSVHIRKSVLVLRGFLLAIAKRDNLICSTDSHAGGYTFLIIRGWEDKKREIGEIILCLFQFFLVSDGNTNASFTVLWESERDEKWDH